MTTIVDSPGGSPGASPRRRQSIRDVAQLAGVSVGTVSNVLNRPAVVAEETRARVEDAIRRLGFVRHGPARQLRAGTSRAVGAIVLDISNPFFTDVARGIEDRLAEDDYILILASSDERREKEQRYLRLLEEQGVQGILVSPAESDLSWLDATRERGTAVVLLDRTSPTPGLCSVAVDDVRGGELAAAHLIERGHRRIGLVNGSSKISQCADRRKGRKTAEERQARLEKERRSAEVRASADTKARAIADCGMCDADGFIAPTVKCLHDTAAVETARRGAAKVAAALAAAAARKAETATIPEESLSA